MSDFILNTNIHGFGGPTGSQGALQIVDFSFSASSPPPPPSTGLSSAIPEFGEVQVTLGNASGLTTLLDAMAKGTDLGALSLVEQTEAGPQGGAPVTLLEVDLAHTHVTAVSENADGTVSVSLSYTQIGVTTHQRTETGQAGPAQTFGFSLPTEGVAPPPPAGHAGPVGAAVNPTHFFLMVDGVNGGSSDPNHTGWFDLNGFDLAAVEKLLGGSGGGAGAAVTQIDPISLSLPGLGDTQLLADLASGAALNMRIEGVNGQGTAVYDLNLVGANVSHMGQQGEGGANGETDLSVTVHAYSLTTTGITATGQVGAPQTTSWNFTTDSSSVTVPNMTPGTGEAVTTEASQFYLNVPGVTGGSLAIGHVGSLEVASFSFGADADPSHPPQFGELDLTFGNETGLTAFLHSLTSGQGFSGMTLQGATDLADHTATSYELDLSNVVVTDVEQTAGGGYTVSLGYGAIEETALPGAGPDTLGTPEHFTYNDLIHQAGGTVSSVAAPGTAVGAVAPQTFYLLIPNVNGDSTDPGHVGWFKLSSFDMAALSQALSGIGSGAGAGRAEAEPISIDLPNAAGIVDLLKAVAQGGSLAGATIEGVASGQTLYSLHLGDVNLSQVSQSQGGVSLDLDYQSFQLTTHSLDQTGQATSPQTTSWDFATNSPDVSIPAISPGTGGSGAPPANEFALEISGLKGGDLQSGAVGAFSVTDFSFTAEAGDGTDRPSFGSLTVTLPNATGLVGLLHDLTTAPPTGAALVGLENGQTGVAAVYRYTLGNAVVTGVAANADGSVSVTLGYQSVEVQTSPGIDPPPGFTSEQFTYSNSTGELGASVPTINAPGTAAPPVHVDNYFMLVDGLNGGSTDTQHQGWFSLDNFSIQTLLSSVGGSSGAGAGAPEVAATPLTVTVDNNAGLTDLLNALATGERISGIRIEGVTGAKEQATYDLNLVGVHVVGVTTDAAGQTQVQLAYDGFQLTTHGVSNTGVLSDPQTVSWNFATDSSVVQVPVISPSGGETVPDAPTALALDPTTDSGLQGDRLTNHAQVEIDGHATAGDTVTLMEGATVLGSAVADGSGNFQITSSALADGQHTLTATDTNSDGTVSAASGGLTVTVDTQPPGAPTGLALDASTDTGAVGDGSTSDQTVQIDGHAEAGATVTLFDGQTAIGTATADGSGDFQINATLGNGDHVITATAEDAAGNTGPVSAALDLHVASVSLNPDSGSHTVAEQPDLTGSAGLDTVSATLGFTDSDTTAQHTVDVGDPTIVWSGGTAPAALAGELANALTTSLADSTGTGTGSLTATFSAADSDFDFLAAGETLKVTYDVSVTDGSGATSEQPVTFTVTGANDAPVFKPANSAIHLDGSDFVNFTQPAAFTGGGAYTYEATFRTGQTSGDFQSLISVGTFNGGAQMQLWLTPDGHLAYGVNNEFEIGHGAFVGDDQWHTVAAVYDGAGHHFLYLDGQLVGTATGGINLTGGAALIGAAGSTPTHFFHGDIDSVAVWNTALGAGQIAAGAPLTGSEPGLTGYWTFNDDSGSTIVGSASTLGNATAEGAVTHVSAGDPPALALTEVAGATGSTTADAVSTTLAFTDADLSDTHTLSVGAPSLSLSGGAAAPAGLATSLADALGVTLTDSTGSGAGSVAATFSAADGTFDFLAAGETLTVSYSVTIDDGNGGTASQPVTIVVTGTNDAPVVAADTASHAILEGGAGTDTVSGSLAFTDVDLTDQHSASVGDPSLSWTGLGDLPSGLAAALKGALTTSLTDSTGTGAGSLGFSFSAADSAFTFLAKGETLTVTYDVTVDDGNGGTSTQPVTITVTGANQAPVLSADAGPHAITEAAGMTASSASDTASTTLAFTDPDLDDHHTLSVGAPSLSWSGAGALPDGLATSLTDALTTALTDSTGSGAGSIAATFSAADGTFDFLAAGETLTITYDVTVDDGNGGTAMQPVTIVVTGTNDAPVIAEGSATAATVNELANTTGSTSLDQASGVLTFHDPDLSDRPTVTELGRTVVAHDAAGHAFTLSAQQVQALEADVHFSFPQGSNDASVDWSFSSQDAALDFLGAGESVTITTTVEVDDHHGGTLTEPVTITLQGANDAPVAEVDFNSDQKNGTIKVDAKNGVLANDHDPDVHDSLTVSAVDGQSAGVGQAVAGKYGTLTLNADGSYSYVATHNGALPPSGVGQENFTYTVSDGHGGSDTETLTITVFNNGDYTLADPKDLTVTGGNGKQTLDAGVGSHVLIGGNAPDVLVAGWGADTLTGGNGPDTFVFGHGGFGATVITDFSNPDSLQFDKALFTSFADVMSHAQQVGHDVVITLDAQDTITLKNIALSSLHSNEMVFV